MASIVSPITSARQLQQQFKEYDRDYYPYGVYESLVEMFEETYGDDEPYELDVIGLCCDIQGITEDDVIDDLDADDEGLVSEEAIIDALTDAANNEGYLLWVGKDEGDLVAYYI